MNPALRTKTVTTKLTSAEYDELLTWAGEPLTSEWARGKLLMLARRSRSEETLLAEVLALRVIVVNALTRGADPVAHEAMRAIVDYAEKDKRAKAQAALK